METKVWALLAAGLATVAIAGVHVVALLIGAKALAYLDAPELAQMWTERGPLVPVVDGTIGRRREGAASG